MKKIFLFNYFLQKCMLKVQELLNLDDDAKASQLGIIVSKARLFHRTASGCTMEELYFCNPMYAQELFLYFCYCMEDKGESLLRCFDFHRYISYLPGMYSVECYEDKDISHHLERLYPVVSQTSDIDVSLYNKLVGTHTEDDLLKKFRQVSNFRGVTPLYMENIPTAKTEMELIDKAWRRIENKQTFINMLVPHNKHDHNGRSHAYNAYFNKMNI